MEKYPPVVTGKYPLNTIRGRGDPLNASPVQTCYRGCGDRQTGDINGRDTTNYLMLYILRFR